MAAAVVNEIADAVVDTLNAADMSFGVDAERMYIPVHSLRELGDLKTPVVPSILGLSTTILNRKRQHSYDVTVDVGVQRRVPDRSRDALDALAGLVQEIIDLFLKGAGSELSLSGDRTARVTSVANDPVFDPAHLDEHGVFTSVVTLTIREIR